MFEFICGTIYKKEPGTLVIDVGGVGYLLEIPASTYSCLPAIGAQARVLVHYHVREDAHKLFGFAAESERDTFRKLISITGIGPKVALAVLSHISINDLAYSIIQGDTSRLKAIPGIGLKTAQRLAVELKGKLHVETGDGTRTMSRVQDKTAGSSDNIEQQAFSAMISLGYSELQVVKSLSRVRETQEPSMPVEEWIRRALQVI